MHTSYFIFVSFLHRHRRHHLWCLWPIWSMGWCIMWEIFHAKRQKDCSLLAKYVRRTTMQDLHFWNGICGLWLQLVRESHIIRLINLRLMLSIFLFQVCNLKGRSTERFCTSSQVFQIIVFFFFWNVSLACLGPMMRCKIMIVASRLYHTLMSFRINNPLPPSLCG